MKKHILAIILCVLCASLVFVLASCGDTNTDSGSGECIEHSFGDWTTKTYASCTSAGLKVRVCKNCSYEDEEEIPAGHNFGDWETVKEVSCEEDGLEERICSACDFVEPKEIKAEGHDWGDWEVSVPGDCTTKGEEKKVCGNCGDDETREIAANGHDWTDWGIGWDNEEYAEAPTCTEEGYLGRVCLVCGGEERDPIPAKDHEWGDWSVVGSCADGATKTRECTACGEDETETTAAGEHANIVFEGAVEATREQDGSTGIKKCLACGETLAPAKIVRISNIASLSTVTSNASHWQVVGNDWAPNTLTFLVDGKRDTGMPSCAKSASQWVLMTFENAVDLDVFELVCNGSGNVGALGNVENTNNNVDVTVTFYDEDGNILLSEIKNTENVTSLVFELDFDKPVKKIRMSYAVSYQAYALILFEAEAYTTEYLSPCDANGHNWGEGWKTINPAVCTPDSLTDGLERRICENCGEMEENVIKAAHNWTEWNMSGITCATGGTKTRTCDVCGKVESETVPADGHLNVVLQGKIAPTLEADGHTGNEVCTACGETVKEGTVIPKIVNQSASATVGTTGGWAIDGSTGSTDTRPYLNDGNMNTGMTTYTAHGDDTHSLTWAEAVTIDTIKIFFNGDGTGKTVGYFAGQLANTNADTTITVTVYGADGNVVKTQGIQTKDLTEFTIDLGADTQVTKIDLKCYVGWNGDKVVNIWECQAYKKYVD